MRKNIENVAKPTKINRTDTDIHADIVAAMNEPLKAEYRKLKAAMTSASTKTIAVRHKAGLIVLRVKNKKGMYGERAVQKLEGALGLDAKSLYRLADVAEVWPTESALAKVLSRRNARGLPLTWSHLERLAVVESQPKREKAIKQALALSMSVRQLQDWIKGVNRSARTKSPKQASNSNTVEGRIGELTMRVEQLAWDLEEWKTTLPQLPVGQLAVKVADSLKRAEAVHARLVEACTESLKGIRTALARTPAAPAVVQQAPAMTAAAA